MPHLLPARISKHRLLWACCVLLLYGFYMVWPINLYLAESLKSTYLQAFIPVFVAAVLYFRRRCGAFEYRLMLAFLLWFFLTRLMNRNYALLGEYVFLEDLALMIPLTLLGLYLSAEERRYFLNWFSAVVGGFYFLLGLVALSLFVRRGIWINPANEISLGVYSSEGFQRLNLFDVNPCVTAYWYLAAFYLMVYQFFACRRKLWRIPIVLAALVFLAVIACTYTRSVKLGIALTLGLLAASELGRLLRRSRRLLRLPVLILTCLTATLLLYECSDLLAQGISKLSYTLYPLQIEQPVQASPAPAPATPSPAPATPTPAPLPAEGKKTAARPSDARPQLLSSKSKSSVQALDENTPIWVDKVVDPRKWSGNLDRISSARFTVWRSAYLALKLDPSVLWRGKLLRDSMKLSNPFTPHNPYHYHNVPIQALMTTGIPGFLLVTALMLCVLYKALRLLFSHAPRIPLPARVLALPVIGVQFYSMLEIGMYTATDIRALYYYIMSGLLLGVYRDLFPEARF